MMYKCSSCHDDFPEDGQGDYEIVKVQKQDDLKGNKDQFKCRLCINLTSRTSKIARLITTTQLPKGPPATPPRG